MPVIYRKAIPKTIENFNKTFAVEFFKLAHNFTNSKYVSSKDVLPENFQKASEQAFLTIPPRDDS